MSIRQGLRGTGPDGKRTSDRALELIERLALKTGAAYSRLLLFRSAPRAPRSEPKRPRRAVLKRTPRAEPRRAPRANKRAETDRSAQPFRSLEFYNRLGIVISGLLIFLVGGWSAVALISGAVVSQAKVVVEGGTQSVQHLEGGILKKIGVQEGQLVRRGTILLNLDTTKAQSKVKYLDAQIASLNSQILLIDEQLSGLSELFEKGLSLKSEILITQRRRVELSGQSEESQAQLKGVQDEILRATLRAPITGHVHQLSVHTIGGVVQPGETILQVIPTDGPLAVEAKLGPRKIDQVRIGQSAAVKFTSFDQRTTPELSGAVKLVAADLARDHATSPAYYKVRIEIGADQLARLGGKQLKPGMPAEVFILTQSRPVLSYFLKPFYDQLTRAFRE